MRRVIITAMMAVVWLGYKEKFAPKPIQSTQVEAKSVDELYQTASLFIKSEESLKLKPYKCAGGKWTIGWGHVMTKKERWIYRHGISLKEANELFDKDYKKFIKEVKRRFPELKSRKKILVTSMIAYNIGMSFVSDNLGEAIKEGRSIKRHLFKYKMAKGRVLKGLIKRREAELELWNASTDEFIAAADYYKELVDDRIKRVL